MAQIVKLPVQASKLGYKRVRRRRRRAENPDQLDLFPQAGAQIIDFVSPDLGPFERALLSDERGDRRAAEYYARAIDEEDCVADAYCNMGIIESQQGNMLKAFDCFTTSLKHDPRHSEAHYNLANLYFDQGDFRLAQLHFAIAVETDPSFANAYFNLALVLAMNNDLAAALSTLSKYTTLVGEEQAEIAEPLLEHLKRSLAAGKGAGFGAK